MDDNRIRVFASEEYLLLRWLAQHPTQTSNESVVKFSQNELAQELGCVRRRGTTARPLKSDSLTAENRHPFR